LEKNKKITKDENEKFLAKQLGHQILAGQLLFFSYQQYPSGKSLHNCLCTQNNYFIVETRAFIVFTTFTSKHYFA